MRHAVLPLLLAPAIAQADVAAVDETTVEADNEPAQRPTVEAVTPLQAPVPLVMPELTARKRFDLGILASVGDVNLFELQVSGGYAFDKLEVFGDLRARAQREIDSEDSGGAAFGNIKLGARYHVPLGEFVVAPSLTLWLPTASGALEEWDAVVRRGGVSDGRAYIAEGGLGIAASAAWYRRSAFIQLEGGTAFVVEHGPQVASVFAALGVGRQFMSNLALMLEWRFEMFPVYETIQGPGVGIIRGAGATRLRMRFHPYASGDVVGALCGFDIMTRFP